MNDECYADGHGNKEVGHSAPVDVGHPIPPAVLAEERVEPELSQQHDHRHDEPDQVSDDPEPGREARLA